VIRAPLAVVGLALGLTGCGGGDGEAAPAAWCNTTGRVVYLIDQYSTTLDTEALGAWAESAPEEIRASAGEMAAALRRYPVDADAPDLVAAREKVEAYAEDSCAEGWRGPFARS
jgi:hypothetical protein